jgi:hypothetical protein
LLVCARPSPSQVLPLLLQTLALADGNQGGGWHDPSVMVRDSAAYVLFQILSQRPEVLTAATMGPLVMTLGATVGQDEVRVAVHAASVRVCVRGEFAVPSPPTP